MGPNQIIVEKDLSYKIVGALFDVHTELGPGYQEKYYQRAVAKRFEQLGLKFERELMGDLYFGDEKVGKYYLDFLVENKIVVELKTIPQFHPNDFR